MRINTQFPVAVHILTVIAYFRTHDVPSDIIARSVGTNPVVIRRIMARLKKAGLVETQSGVKGAKLLREPGHITLLDIYNAVRDPEDVIFDIHPHPFAGCLVGCHFKDAVSRPLEAAQKALEKELAASTLADIVADIAEKCKSGG